MVAVREDFDIREGRDFTLVVTVTDQDESASLDGALNIEFAAARHSGSYDRVIYKYLDNGIALTSEDLVFEVDIAGTDTWGLEGKYYYEVVVTTSDNRRITVTYGYLTVSDSLIGESSE